MSVSLPILLLVAFLKFAKSGQKMSFMKSTNSGLLILGPPLSSNTSMFVTSGLRLSSELKLVQFASFSDSFEGDCPLDLDNDYALFRSFEQPDKGLLVLRMCCNQLTCPLLLLVF